MATQDEMREIENFVLAKRLDEVNHPDHLRFLARLIVDHDHLREKLMTEPAAGRREKFEAMRPYLRFRAASLDSYELAELARACGVQPIYEEEKRVEAMERVPSFIHEVH